MSPVGDKDLQPGDGTWAAVAYTQRTKILAESNFDNLFPWRWLRFWRVSREIERRRAVFHAWRTHHEEQQ